MRFFLGEIRRRSKKFPDSKGDARHFLIHPAMPKVERAFLAGYGG
jgi:hypothetical protein